MKVCLGAFCFFAALHRPVLVLGRRLTDPSEEPHALAGAEAMRHERKHAGIHDALGCLDEGRSVEAEIQKGVDGMRRAVQSGAAPEDVPGPRVMRIPFVHGSVFIGDWNQRDANKVKQMNCIEKAVEVVALEGELEVARAAADMRKLLLSWAESGPWRRRGPEEKTRDSDLFESLRPTRKILSQELSQILGKLGKIWTQYSSSKDTSSAALKAMASELETHRKLLVAESSKIRSSLAFAFRVNFPDDSSCASFSNASLRSARFLRCLETSDLRVRQTDGKVQRMREWGRGVYLAGSSRWDLFSRAASKAARSPQTWQAETAALLASGSSNSLARCAAELLPINMGLDAEPGSPQAQAIEAKTLKCLPALLNSPGFHGMLIEEKDRPGLSAETVVDRQCVMPSTCGRLGAAVMTGWQGHHYGGVGSVKAADWKLDDFDLDVIHPDCLALDSAKSYVCYDFSHKCFPEVMKYICHALPACCPTLGGASGSCGELSAAEFARDNSACDVCHAPGSLVHGGSVKNWLQRSFTGKGPLEKEIQILSKMMAAKPAVA